MMKHSTKGKNPTIPANARIDRMVAIRDQDLHHDRPLAPRNMAARVWAVMAVLFLLTGILVQQNYAELRVYIDRPISVLEINSNGSELKAGEIQAILAAHLGQGFFSFDVRAVQDQLEQHPWIAGAAIKRNWPDTLSVRVVEQRAIARWGSNSLLNQYGEIFSPERMDHLANLPLLVGPQDSQYQVMTQYQNLRRLMLPASFKLQGLSLSTRGSWKMILDDGMEVTIGRSDITSKVNTMIDFIRGQADFELAQIESVDLRYSNGISVKHKQQDLGGIANR